MMTPRGRRRLDVFGLFMYVAFCVFASLDYGGAFGVGMGFITGLAVAREIDLWFERREAAKKDGARDEQH